MLKYFISREFLLTILGLIGFGVLAYLAIFFWFLPSYTRHGAGQLVPDVYEFTQADAFKALDKAGLRPMVSDSTFRDDLPPLTVIKQYPAAYSRVKPNRSVLLTVNQKAAPMVNMPKIDDMTLYQAKNRLESWKVGLGKVRRIPDIGKDKILKVTYKGKPISEGDPIPQGSKIDVVVGDGLTSWKVQIPDLEGYTYEDALGLLGDMRLGLGSVIYTPEGPEESMGRVYSQSPKAGFGDSINVGYSIDLYIYGQEPEENEGILIEELDGN